MEYAYAKDRLENRLLSAIRRTLTGIAGQAADVRFVVLLEDNADEPGQLEPKDTRPKPPEWNEIGLPPVLVDEPLDTLDWTAPALGGRHQLLLFGEQAIEAQAFSRIGGEPLEAAIYGWLRTTWVDGRSEAVLIVDRVTFYLRLRERKRAIELIKQMGRDGYSKRGRVRRGNGDGEAHPQKKPSPVFFALWAHGFDVIFSDA